MQTISFRRPEDDQKTECPWQVPPHREPNKLIEARDSQSEHREHYDNWLTGQENRDRVHSTFLTSKFYNKGFI